jgi:single-strand DNA-binding protein
MSSVNKVILVGNCGKDPEVRYLPSGKAVANVSLATTSRRKDPNTGEVIEDTQWHRVTFYDRLAEVVGEYVKKGASIYVEGRIKYGKYTDQAGIEKMSVDIVANEMQLLGRRDDGGGQQGQQQAPQGQQRQQSQQPQRQQSQQHQQALQGQQRQQPTQNQQQPARQAQRPASGFDDMDDTDIPF